MSATDHEGGCLCGAIRFRVSGEPIDTNICTCTQCQKQSGAPLPVFATYALEHFLLVKGEPATFRSSEFAIRQFCPNCGSSLFWRRDGSGSIDIFLCAFDRPGDLPAPSDHIWAQHKVPWLPELPGVPTYPGRRTGN